MLIRVNRNLGAGLPNYTEAQVVDVCDEEGEMLCKRGLAVQIGVANPAAIQAVPPEPEIVEEELKPGQFKEIPAGTEIKPYYGKKSKGK